MERKIVLSYREPVHSMLKNAQFQKRSVSSVNQVKDRAIMNNSWGPALEHSDWTGLTLFILFPFWIKDLSNRLDSFWNVSFSFYPFSVFLPPDFSTLNPPLVLFLWVFFFIGNRCCCILWQCGIFYMGLCKEWGRNKINLKMLKLPCVSCFTQVCSVYFPPKNVQF